MGNYVFAHYILMVIEHCMTFVEACKVYYPANMPTLLNKKQASMLDGWSKGWRKCLMGCHPGIWGLRSFSRSQGQIRSKHGCLLLTPNAAKVTIVHFGRLTIKPIYIAFRAFKGIACQVAMVVFVSWRRAHFNFTFLSSIIHCGR